MLTVKTGAPSHISDTPVAAHRSLTDLERPLVAISSVLFKLTNEYDQVRFNASLQASAAYREADVPQIVMVDPASHNSVATAFMEQGAFVAPTPRPGLATPYIDAGWLARRYAGEQACVLKAEADKRFTAGTLSRFSAELKDCDVLVGERDLFSMESMSAVQERTEGLLDIVLPMLLPGLPHGITSGVQAYSPQGLNMLLGYDTRHLKLLGNKWLYLFTCPLDALEAGLKTATVSLPLIYDAAMVEAESRPDIVFKRFTQLLEMLEGACHLASKTHPLLAGRAEICNALIDQVRQRLV